MSKKKQEIDLVAVALQNAAPQDKSADGKAYWQTWEQLRGASEATLQTLILSRLNLAANLKQDIADLTARLADQLADIRLAELLLQSRRPKTEEK